MTARLDALDDELHRSEAFWHELGEQEVVYAETLVAAFDEPDWRALDAVWRLRPAEWQRCLATLLATAFATATPPPPRVVPWLLEMIERGDDAVAIQAIDELRALQRGHALALRWPEAAIVRVRALWRRHRGFTHHQIEQFLDDMAAGRF